jgi:hypothetical protein
VTPSSNKTIQVQSNWKTMANNRVPKERDTLILDIFMLQVRLKMGACGLYITQQNKWYQTT